MHMLDKLPQEAPALFCQPILASGWSVGIPSAVAHGRHVAGCASAPSMLKMAKALLIYQ